MSACVLYSSASGMCNFTRQRGMYVGTWAIPCRGLGAGPALPTCSLVWFSGASEAMPARACTVRVAETVVRDGMPLESAFRSRETFSTSTKDSLSQSSRAGRFCVCVLEMWWSRRCRCGELRKRVNDGRLEGVHTVGLTAVGKAATGPQLASMASPNIKLSRRLPNLVRLVREIK
jgi:hypothetical protein